MGFFKKVKKAVKKVVKHTAGALDPTGVVSGLIDKKKGDDSGSAAIQEQTKALEAKTEQLAQDTAQQQRKFHQNSVDTNPIDRAEGGEGEGVGLGAYDPDELRLQKRRPLGSGIGLSGRG